MDANLYAECHISYEIWHSAGEYCSRRITKRRNALYHSKLARNCIVRVPLAEVIWPNDVDVGPEVAMSKNGWFRKFNATRRKVIRIRSLMRTSLLRLMSRR